MLDAGAGFFIQIPGKTKERILRPAKVTSVADGIIAAELEEPDLAIEAGMDVLVYFEIRHQFMMQPARIEAVLQSDPRCAIGLMTTGQPVSAEARQAYRVSTVMADLIAIINMEECALLDVSASGFAVLSTAKHGMGKYLPVVLKFQGTDYQGNARVQSICDVPDGRIRYGLDSQADKRSGGDLLKGQRQITMAIQRQQLRRLSRS